jgi:hypothetical protein
MIALSRRMHTADACREPDQAPDGTAKKGHPFKQVALTTSSTIDLPVSTR